MSSSTKENGSNMTQPLLGGEGTSQNLSIKAKTRRTSAGGKKRGAKKGSKRRLGHTHAFWYELCKEFVEYKGEISQTGFLKKKDAEDPEYTFSQSDLQCFSRRLREYRSGKLIPSEQRRAIRRDSTKEAAPNELPVALDSAEPPAEVPRNQEATEPSQQDATLAKQNEENEQPSLEPPQKKRRGPKLGSKQVSRPKSFWYAMCEDYANAKKKSPKISRAKFLQTKASLDPDYTYRPVDLAVFGKYIKSFEAGELQDTDELRKRDGKYPEVEFKLIEYVRDVRRLGISVPWSELQEKLQEWKQELVHEHPKYKDFNGSAGFIGSCLKRHNEGTTIVPPTYEEAMTGIDAVLGYMRAHDSIPDSLLSLMEEAKVTLQQQHNPSMPKESIEI